MAKQNKHRIRGCLSTIFKFIWISYFAIMIIGAIIGGLSAIFEDDTKNVARADGFTIEAYNVVLDVKENNPLDKEALKRTYFEEVFLFYKVFKGFHLILKFSQNKAHQTNSYCTRA